MVKAIHINVKDACLEQGIGRVLKSIADKLGVSETTAVHLAVNRFYFQLFSADEIDYPTQEQVAEINAKYSNEADQTLACKRLIDLI